MTSTLQKFIACFAAVACMSFGSAMAGTDSSQGVDARDVRLSNVNESYCSSIDGTDYTASNYFRDAADVLAKTGATVQSRNPGGKCCTASHPWNGSSCAGATASCPPGTAVTSSGACMLLATPKASWCAANQSGQWIPVSDKQSGFGTSGIHTGYGVRISMLCEPARSDGQVRMALRLYETSVNSYSDFQFDAPIQPSVKSEQIQNSRYQPEQGNSPLLAPMSMGEYKIIFPGFHVFTSYGSRDRFGQYGVPYTGWAPLYGGIDVYVTDAGCSSATSCQIDVHTFLQDHRSSANYGKGNGYYTAQSCPTRASTLIPCWRTNRQFVTTSPGKYSPFVNYSNDVYSGEPAYMIHRVNVGGR